MAGGGAEVNDANPSTYAERYAAAKAAGTTLPSNHSSLFAPDVDPALHTGIAAEVTVLRNLLNGSAEELRKLSDRQSSH